MLEAERDTDDRNAEEQSECKMDHRYLDTSDKNPDDVHYD